MWQKKSLTSGDEEETLPPANLLMQADDMVSWLQYPMDEFSFDRYLYSDILYPPSGLVSAPGLSPFLIPLTSVAPPPPMNEYVPSTSNKPAEDDDITVADSNETPVANIPESSTAHVSGRKTSIRFETDGKIEARKVDTCELTLKSSPGTEGAGRRASASEGQSSQLPSPRAVVDRKRKDLHGDASANCHIKDIGFECTDGKKQGCGSTSVKRSRAAEVHNLSERRRRDRVNEKMKALQEIIPRCNKSDKASMLDKTIEYMKSLKMQVQQMSTRCSMVPLMFPGVQQYMPPMAVGMNFGMVPYPSVLPGSTMPPAVAASHMAPLYPVPAFQLMPPPVTVTDPSRVQATNSADPMMNSFAPQNPNQVRMLHFIDPYQQFLSFQQAQAPLPQVDPFMHWR